MAKNDNQNAFGRPQPLRSRAARAADLLLVLHFWPIFAFSGKVPAGETQISVEDVRLEALMVR